MDILTIVDNNLLIFGGVGLVVFAGICYAVFNLALKTTRFEDAYPTERLQLLMDEKKKEKKAPKPVKKKNKPKKNKEDQPKTETTPVEEMSPVEEIILPMKSNVVEAVPENSSPVESVGEKKKNKKNKQKKNVVEEAVETNTSVDENIVEAVESPVEVQTVETVPKQEEFAAQKSNKKRSKRAVDLTPPAHETITNIDENKFISRIANIEGLESEYLAYISEFISQTNKEKCDKESLKDQVNHVQKQLKEKEKSLKTKDDEISKMKKEFGIAKAEASEAQLLSKELSEIKTLNSKITTELNSTKEVLRVTIQKQQDNGEVNKLKNELSDAKNHIQMLTNQTSESQRYKNEVNQLKEKINEIVKTESQKSKDLEDRLRAAESSFSSLQNYTKKLEEEKHQLFNREQQISFELGELQQQLNMFASTRMEKENVAQAANKEQIKLNSQIDELTNELSAYKASVNKLNVELKNVANENYSFQQRFIEQSKAIEEFNEEKVDLLKKLDISEKKLNDFLGYYETSQSQIQEMKNALKGSELEKNELKKQLIESNEMIEKLGEQKNQTPQGPSPDAVKEIETLKQEKEHLYNRMLNLTEAVNKAESLTAKIVKEKEAQTKDLLSSVGSIVAEVLEVIGVKPSKGKFETVDSFKNWLAESIVLVQQVMSEDKKAASESVVIVEKNSEEKPTSEAADNKELKKLREENKQFKTTINNMEKMIHRIEEAYQEQAKEFEKKLQETRSIENFKPSLPSPGSSTTGTSEEWELVR